LADSDTIIWISGATGGIGLEMARQQPCPGARVAQALEDKSVAIPADKAARDIWAALPPTAGEILLLFGKMVEPPRPAKH